MASKPESRALAVDLPILGVGGVGSAWDAVEYLMAGATLVGVCTAGHMNGTVRYAKIISERGGLLAPPRSRPWSKRGVARPAGCA